MNNNKRGKFLLIVNPKSGTGSYAGKLEKVARYFKKNRMGLEVRMTEHPGHAIKIARAASKKKYDAVIGAGGDGTINEVANGLAGSRMKMGILPWGTGNVFAREMRFPPTIRGLCRVIRGGHSCRLDLGRCGKRHFLLMCGVGFDAYSLRQMDDPAFKRSAGLFSYAAAALKAFARYRFPELEVTAEDGKKRTGTLVLISNTSRYGAFFSIMPRANPSDGLLDVFVYRDSGKWNLVKLVLRLVGNALSLNSPKSHTLFLKKQGAFRTRALKITSRSPVYCQLDGDLYAPLPAEISIRPRALEVILPKRAVRRYSRAEKRVPEKPRAKKSPPIFRRKVGKPSFPTGVSARKRSS